jgi:hypothetical protein
MCRAVPITVGTVRSVPPESERPKTLPPAHSYNWARAGATNPATASRWNQS